MNVLGIGEVSSLDVDYTVIKSNVKKSLFTLFYAWKHCNNLKSDNMLYNALQASDSENLASHNPTMSKEW